MKILVTGGAGFIGSHVVDAYLNEGHDVVVVDNLATGFAANVNKKAKFYKTDLRNARAVEKVFVREKPEVVNHQAAQASVNVSVQNPVYDAQVNVLGSLNVLESCRKFGVERVIYSSSGGTVYGEPKYFPVDEKHPTGPISPYGVTKLAVENYLAAFGKAHGLDSVVLRYANVFGPRQDPNGEAGVIAIFSGKMLAGKRPTIFGTGLNSRDYVHVSDVARANVLALTKGDSAYNIGTGKPTTVKQVFSILAGLLDFREKPIFAAARPGEVKKLYLDASKARLELSWKPVFDVERGMAQALEYYRKAR